MKPFIYCLVLLLLFNCTGYQYVPTPVYVPINEKKGDLKVNISTHSFQAGYAFSDHFSAFLMGNTRKMSSPINFESMFSKENSGTYTRSDSTYDIHFGVSYFFKTKPFNYEILFGSGFGKVGYSNEKDTYSDNYHFNMSSNKYSLFIQPNIAWKVKGHLELALFSRFIFYNYYNIKSNVVPGSNGLESYDKYLINTKNASLYFAEPGISVKVGTEKVKFAAQIFRPISFVGEIFRYNDNNNNSSNNDDNSTFKLYNDKIRYRNVNAYFSVFVDLNILDMTKNKKGY